MEPPKPRIQKPKEKIKKCPNCGATLSESMLTCPECGYEFTMQSETSEEFQRRLDKLKEDLAKADEAFIEQTRSLSFFSTERGDKRQFRNTSKAEFIKAFTMPVTKEGLLQLLEFSYSNYITTKEDDDHRYNDDDNPVVIHKAWEIKYRQTYSMLKRYSVSDMHVKAVLDAHDNEVNNDVNKENKEKDRKELENKRYYIYFIIIPMAFLFFMYLIEGNQKKEARDQIEFFLNNKDFDRAKDAVVGYPSDERDRVYDEIVQKEINYYISIGNLDKAQVTVPLIKDETMRVQMEKAVSNVKKQ